MPRKGRKPRPPIERTMDRVVFHEDGCWLFTGALKPNGYGAVEIPGPGPKSVRVHRLVYEHVVGPIPEGLDLDHLCRVRNCVNPDHLEPVTRSENLRRSPLLSAAALRRHALNPERVREIGKKGGEANRTKEARQAHSDRVRALWQDPGYRAKQREALQARKGKVSSSS